MNTHNVLTRPPLQLTKQYMGWVYTCCRKHPQGRMLSARSVVQCHFFFFFSSRRRHTRFDCDWSSDVCSSDLIHVYEGTTLLGTTTTTWFDATLGTGDHTLRVELRNNDHTPLSPAVSAQITVHVGPPELKILEPVAASSVSALGFRMRFVVSNFTLDSEDYAGVSIPGAGHIHVYQGTTLLTTTVSDHVTITGLATGGITLRVELRNNDHSPLGSPVFATTALTVVTPSIALTAPSSITAGEDLRIAWTVTGFVLDSAAFGGTPEAGRGHVPGFVHRTYSASTASTSFGLTGLAAGLAHTRPGV